MRGTCGESIKKICGGVGDGEDNAFKHIIIIRCTKHECTWWCGLSDAENENSWVNANTKEVTMITDQAF